MSAARKNIQTIIFGAIKESSKNGVNTDTVSIRKNEMYDIYKKKRGR
ncbi:hypothetical protein ACFLR5_00980 [Elusimicrobiota bacterium]